MTIYRNGKAIELTAQELREAYEEQQRIYDIEDIANYISDTREYYSEYSDSELRELLPQFLEEYAGRIGQAWYDCAEDAVDAVLNRTGVLA